ncbi:MAG: NYN domain-containing protein [Chloroflexota bacterium]|nr:NYN domain-containing protein [Chloroflexota bacterium]
MLILIDGHNLIPHMPGLSLTDMDDESELIPFLQEYCRVRRRTVEVYFDRAPVGKAGQRQMGQVKAVFVRANITADEAIMARLAKLGKKARNVLVVSSDRQVQQAARAAHAKVVPSDDFAAELVALKEERPSLDPRNRLLSELELSEWEALFRKGHPPDGGKT